MSKARPAPWRTLPLTFRGESTTNDGASVTPGVPLGVLTGLSTLEFLFAERGVILLLFPRNADPGVDTSSLMGVSALTRAGLPDGVEAAEETLPATRGVKGALLVGVLAVVPNVGCRPLALGFGSGILPLFADRDGPFCDARIMALLSRDWRGGRDGSAGDAKVVEMEAEIGEVVGWRPSSFLRGQSWSGALAEKLTMAMLC